MPPTDIQAVWPSKPWIIFWPAIAREVLGRDPDPLELAQITRTPTQRSADALATAGDALWALGRFDGVQAVPGAEYLVLGVRAGRGHHRRAGERRSLRLRRDAPRGAPRHHRLA